MTRGIDQQVTALADAYRKNPAALQQNYKVNQDLLALLALRQLNEEHKQKEAEIAMSQDPASQTVAQQQADEAIGRSKKEILEQVGGIAQLQKGRQQQNLQRTAAGAPPANPQMAGIANQPAPKMARMAKGGIVSFAGPEGSEVKSPTPEELLREAGFQGNIQEFYNLPKEKQQRVLAVINDRRAFRRPGLSDWAIAGAGDVISSPVRGAVDALGPLFRQFGILSPTQKAIGEDDQWAFTRMTEARRAAYPDVTMEQLFPGSSDPSVDQTRPPGTSSLYSPPVDPAIGPTAVDPAAGPLVDPAVGPLVNPNQNIPDRSLPVPGMGAVDTAALDEVNTTINRIPNKRNFELDQVQADMRKGLPGLKTRMEQDTTAAGTTARDAAAKFQDRTGIKTAYDDMYRDKKALADRQAADRKANLWRTLGAGAGGEGAFANIARTAANERAAEQLREQRALGGLQDLRIGQLATDERIAKESLLSGDKAADRTQKDIENATNNHRQIMADLEGSLSKEAQRGLDVDIANMGAEQFEAQIRFDKALAKLKSSTQVIVAEYNGKIRARGQDIQLRAIESDDRKTIMQGITATDKMIVDIRATIETAVQEAINAEAISADYVDMNATEKANHKNQIRRDITEAFEAQIISQQALRKRLRLKFEGAIEGMRNPTGSYAEEITPAP